MSSSPILPFYSSRYQANGPFSTLQFNSEFVTCRQRLLEALGDMGSGPAMRSERLLNGFLLLEFIFLFTQRSRVPAYTLHYPQFFLLVLACGIISFRCRAVAF